MFDFFLFIICCVESCKWPSSFTLLAHGIKLSNLIHVHCYHWVFLTWYNHHGVSSDDSGSQ